MDVVGLVSGGKDSCYNMMLCARAGHNIVALANLYPENCVELDSFMYQSVGSEGIELISKAMDLPLYRQRIVGCAVNQQYDYEITVGDEVEDLYLLLSEVLKHHPTVKGVSVGAILSSYQKNRVENVCKRLGLTALSCLWERDQKELLREMIEEGVEAIIIKVAAIGLNERHLGKTLAEIEDTMLILEKKYGVHTCGEGGEFESFVVDCPLYKNRIAIKSTETLIHQADNIAPVCILQLKQMELVEK